MFTYTIGTSKDIESTINIDYEAYSSVMESYQPRSYNEMLSCYYKKTNGLILAKDNNNTVGFVYTRRLGVLGWIGPMAVLPKHKKKGIANNLLLRAEALLKSEGCETIGFETTPSLMTYYLKKKWIAIGINYLLSYDIGTNESTDLSVDEISFVENQALDFLETNEYINMKNGVNYETEIINEIDVNENKLYTIYINKKNKGIILFCVKDALIEVKLMNMELYKNSGFSTIQIIFEKLCKNFSTNKVMFSINNQNSLELLLSALNNGCQIKGYSIRFQNKESKIIENINIFESYRWGT